MPVTTGGDTHRPAGLSGPHSRSRQFSVPNRSDSGAGRLDGYSERRPRAAIREHPGPGGICQVPPQRTTNLAHRNTYLLTTCCLLAGCAEYSGQSGIEGLTWDLPPAIPTHVLGRTHADRLHARTTHTHKPHTSRKQVPSVDKLPLLRVRRSLTLDQASIGEMGGQHTTPWHGGSVEEEPTNQPGVNQQRTDPNSAQPCSVSQVSLFQGCRHGATGMGGHGMSKVK